MFDMFGFLRDEGISPEIIAEIQKFRERFPVEGTLSSRVPEPRYLYYGKDVWEEAATALLCGENLLLVGPKATGKNVLAENLACVFGRPSWDVSFYINTDAATLLGTDTFVDGAVSLRKGPIYQCAEKGGFGVLDEINMAKNESLAVLHATLDFRRTIDMPGYERIVLHDATRFIATYECDASQGYKDVLLKAKESDLAIIHSPVGMPGRAVRTPLVERLEQGLRQAPTKCSQCIKGCAPAKIPFCITHALIEAVKGNREEGLFFSGSNVERLDRMVHVRDIMDELMNEWRVST